MQSIKTKDNVIHFNEHCYTALNTYLNESNNSNIFILVDENTHNYCLPAFLSRMETETPIEILEIESGEENKKIDTCSGLWATLSELNADRKSLIINLGGGVITDLGGFVASTFKRGINYVNVPTTLLAMVDASVGGKTGVDLDNLKNQIGVVNSSKMVLIDTSFLKTLPDNQVNSGTAEMLKHGLINSDYYWQKMVDFVNSGSSDFDELIYESVIIKKEIVAKDPNETNLRKTLNFGHTLGHAIESCFLENSNIPNLLHGEAVAIGMILECYISHQQLGFPKIKLDRLVEVVKLLYKPVLIQDIHYSQIIELLKYDKKNEYGNINFVLLRDIGNHEIDCRVDNTLIIKAFNYCNSLMES